MDITMFVDGSCLGNPGPGGWACLLRSGAHEKVLAGSSIEPTTNNRMELMALIAGLRAVRGSRSILVVTDSQYLIGVFSRGWKRKVNHDLLAEGDALMGPGRHMVTFQHVPGHVGHPENERVHREAQAQAERAKSATVGRGPEPVSAWFRTAPDRAK